MAKFRRGRRLNPVARLEIARFSSRTLPASSLAFRVDHALEIRTAKKGAQGAHHPVWITTISRIAIALRTFV
jgi:hypothetical protein